MWAEFGEGDISMVSTVAGEDGLVYLVLRNCEPREIGSIEDPGGITLQDSYHNKRYPVGALRVKHPNDVLTLIPSK